MQFDSTFNNVDDVFFNVADFVRLFFTEFFQQKSDRKTFEIQKLYKFENGDCVNCKNENVVEQVVWYRVEGVE